MSREILFRGKGLDNGKWIEGNFIRRGQTGLEYIRNNDSLLKVDPATVGQYTGLCDKNGKKIFEGDIIKTDFHEMKMAVCYNTRLASFSLENGHWMYPHYFEEAVKPKDVDVIGNIHDNPELLKEEAE